MGLQQVTPAASGAVTLDAVKAWCSIESSDWDDMLTGMILSATAMAENFTGRALGTQAWKLSLDGFASSIDLPKGPVTGVTAVTYIDQDRATQTLSPSIYIVDILSDPQRIVLDPDQSWPATAAVPNAVKIEFQTGFAAPPAPIASAVTMMVAAWFANRESGAAMPAAAADLLRPYRQLRI